MTTTMPWLQQLFARELRAFGDELQLFPHEAQLWQTLPGVTNAAGTLALHVSGNLQHYIGHVLGGSSYVRDRPREFSARDVPRDDVLAELARASAVVHTVLPTLDDDALGAQYPEQLNGVWIPTGLFLLHLSNHLAHHLGQAGYLRRVLTGENQSSGALALSALR